ncbi:SAV_6107 family HEPN domain-containing protein [Ornithinimicrobium faecis]|uniref:SAV_6107 family HEPN domain-containing protein n=1 Tax=Ornithinimicrobium faecis TaxID=2934158 RepID=A0ABY4YY38_9MICO|nr:MULTISPECIES: SAV_6107 family HEPN domain-containing protein [unclassified Ornithinimicrobium]USQ81701.1 SAV_6107 family HEPN domain-containing protein [Ornithinimicrobium sp. HY1793]
MSTQEAPAGASVGASAGTVLDLLDRSRAGLIQACQSPTATERYTEAHLAALRAAAALVAARTVTAGRSRPRSVWEVLPGIAPELGEWAIFFAASGRRRLALERASGGVSAREADDLVRQSESFLELVRAALHLPFAEPLPGELAPTTPW